MRVHVLFKFYPESVANVFSEVLKASINWLYSIAGFIPRYSKLANPREMIVVDYLHHQHVPLFGTNLLTSGASAVSELQVLGEEESILLASRQSLDR